MSLISLNLLRRSNLKSICYRLSRKVSGKATPVEVDRGKDLTEELPKAEPALLSFSPAWTAGEEPALRVAVARDMQVFPDFISEQEEQQLLDELEPVLRKMRYEFDHWDDAIHGYKETERSAWAPHNEAVLRRVRRLAFRPGGEAPLPHAHVLDLAPAGHIKPHVDAVRFCGDVIAGLCLCSAAVMRLRHADHPQREVDALLVRRGLYLMKGTARYDFSHEVLGGERSVWRGDRLPRRRRVAVITRAQPRPQPDYTPSLT